MINSNEMKAFHNAFLSAYDNYYNNGDAGDFDEMMEKGDAILRDKEYAPLLADFANYRLDILTSDREVAAFAKAYTKFCRKPGAREMLHKQGRTPDGQDVRVIQRFNSVGVCEGIFLLYKGEEIEYAFLGTALTMLNDLVRPIVVNV